jgi:hypothetical protein
MTKKKQAPRPKTPRPYSFDYTAKKGSTPRRYLLSGIPPYLWARFEARARREGIAKRQVLLQAVDAWTGRPE